MIDFEKQTLIFGTKEETIKRWETWFRTPFGLHPDLTDAVNRIKSANLDPQITIAAVPVAISETNWECFG